MSIRERTKKREGNDSTSYKEGQPVPAHDEEVYLYHAEIGGCEPGKLVCASCNPTGARPDGERYYGGDRSRRGIGTENMRFVGGYDVWERRSVAGGEHPRLGELLH